ncbi:glycosyltransferase, partial [Eubacterium sp. MSJ-13]|uniref:glycosyltransferase n=1 Tax=Eubacterium sp. MSJ-13 TaxID=2841513 RepID=UPI001C0F4721
SNYGIIFVDMLSAWIFCAYGMTMVEAVVSGLPLITTNSGGIPEYIQNNMAIILDRDNNLIENISRNILKIKQTGQKVDQYKVEEFCEEMCLERYYKKFTQIINWEK